MYSAVQVGTQIRWYFMGATHTVIGHPKYKSEKDCIVIIIISTNMLLVIIKNCISLIEQ